MDELPLKTHLRPATIAKFLGVSLSKVYVMIDHGVIPSIKLRNSPSDKHASIRIPRERFLKWYEERQEEDENKLSA